MLSDEGKLNFALSRLYSTALFTQDHKSFCFALLLLVHFIPLPNIPNKINFSILAHHDTIIEVNKAKCLNSPFNSKSFVNTLGRTKAFNPIPTGQGRNQPLYEHHVTKSGRNRVKEQGGNVL